MARGWPARLALGLALLAAHAPAAGPDDPPVVLVARISGLIDMGLAPFVERALRTAREAGAAAVVFQIDTFGGRLDAAVAVRDHLLRSPVTTVAFIDMRAISAGALISLAAHKIAMVGASTIGAATPVQAGAPSQPVQPASEKTVSYVRKESRATAEARGRPGTVAEAMVDADVQIPGVTAKGKLLTLTAGEALELGVADFRADSLAEVLAGMGLAGARIERLHENWAERTVRLLTRPMVSSLLITIGVLGLLIELRTPGFGLPGLVGVLALATFFWGHWLVRLLGWEEVVLVVGGLLLLLLELFALPGFGVAGVLGSLALMAGLAMSLIGAGATVGAVLGAAARVVISITVALGWGVVFLRFLPSMPLARRLVLGTTLPGEVRPTTEPVRPGLVGQTGITLTPLRPAGIAEVAGRRVDVVSEGDFIAVGERVEVVVEAGHRVVVRRLS